MESFGSKSESHAKKAEQVLGHLEAGVQLDTATPLAPTGLIHATLATAYATLQDASRR